MSLGEGHNSLRFNTFSGNVLFLRSTHCQGTEKDFPGRPMVTAVAGRGQEIVSTHLDLQGDIRWGPSF